MMNPSLLDRVKSVLERMNRREPDAPPEWAAPFRPEPCLTETEIRAWESANDAVLPEEYRAFLLNIGNGGRIAHADSCGFEVWPLDAKRDVFRAGVFPITTKRLNERLAEVRSKGREDSPSFLPELSELQEDGWPLPGCLHFGLYPGGDQVFMVLNGEVRGTIWTAVDDGVPECDRKTGEPF